MPIRSDLDRCYSGAMLGQVMGGYVNGARRLANLSGVSAAAFDRGDIALVALGSRGARGQLSHFVSGKRRLQTETVECLLQACHALLTASYGRASNRTTRKVNLPSAEHLEAELSRSLRLPGPRPTGPDLMFYPRMLAARTADDLGFFDAYLWDHQMPWHGGESAAARTLCLASLRELEVAVRIAQSDDQRLRMASIAVALALHCIPGTREHDDAFDSASTVLAEAGVHRIAMSARSSDQNRLIALRILFEHDWCRVTPQLHSPGNYLRFAMNHTRMPPSQFLWMAPALERIVTNSEQRVSMAPHDPKICADAASVTSFVARLLLVLGDAASIRQADELSARSLLLAGSHHQPAASIYPVLRRVVAGDHHGAATECENVIDRYLRDGRRFHAAAFSALRVQLSPLAGGMEVVCPLIIKLAFEAIMSDQNCFMNSHTFNEDEVRSLLRGAAVPTAS